MNPGTWRVYTQFITPNHNDQPLALVLSLTFHAEFPTPGNWRLFIQFQTSGTLHTAALTVHVS